MIARSTAGADFVSLVISEAANIVAAETGTPVQIDLAGLSSGTYVLGIRTIKGVDSVYDAYRLIPGAATPVA